MEAKQNKWSKSILARYFLLQVPGTFVLAILLVVARLVLPVSTGMAVFILFLWVAKDMLLYPFVWKAYDPTPRDANPSFVGAIAITQERLDPIGYVKVYGQLWRAHSADDSVIEKNVNVQILSREGLTLTVKPVNPDSKSHV